MNDKNLTKDYRKALCTMLSPKQPYISSIHKKNIIANGSYSTIYKHDNKYILKVCSDTNYFYSDFSAEINILTTINHESIIKTEKIIKNNKQIIFVLPKYSETLNEYIYSDNNEKEFFMKKILSGVQFLHSRNILHLDLTERNILIKKVNNKSEPIICDFSLSGIMIDDKLISKTTRITVNYRPYENLIGSNIYTRKSDIWSLGIIFYKMIYNKSIYNFLNVEQYKKLYEYDYESGIISEIKDRISSNKWPYTSDKRIELMLNIDNRIDTNEACKIFNVECNKILKLDDRISDIYLDNCKIPKSILIRRQVKNLFIKVLSLINKKLHKYEKVNYYISCYAIISFYCGETSLFTDEFCRKHLDKVYEIFEITKGDFLSFQK